ncbi:MAG: hypothetical protein KC431_29420, partial [Myxococcales bacterium]|nr:hypothetical protein [Myxococcales bacterium]
DGLQFAGGGVSLWSNAALQRVRLASLAEAGAIVRIGFSSDLTELGPSPLQTVDGDLLIWSTGLSELGGLPALNFVGETLWIDGNALLPTCAAQALADQATVLGPTVITANLADACG